jgi:hypothetical protein
MTRTSLSALAIFFALTATSSAAPVLSVPLPGGYFDAEYFAGSGANTAYFVTDFGGSGGGIHGFGYHWDGTQTADNAMLAIAAAGALDMIYNDFGSPGQPNLFISKLVDPPDQDQPNFNVDGRFWDYFLGTYASNNVSWAESPYGISGRDFTTGDVVQTLINGGFYGFYASANTTTPGLPVAVPEPAGLLLAAIGLWAMAPMGLFKARRQIIRGQ